MIMVQMGTRDSTILPRLEENTKINQVELKMIESMNFTQRFDTLNKVYETKIIYAKIIFIYVCNYEASPDHLCITKGPKIIF